MAFVKASKYRLVKEQVKGLNQALDAEIKQSAKLQLSAEDLIRKLMAKSSDVPFGVLIYEVDESTPGGGGFNLVQWVTKDRKNVAKQAVGEHLGLVQDDTVIQGGYTGDTIRFGAEGVAVVIHPVTIYGKGQVYMGVGKVTEIQGETTLSDRHCAFVYAAGAAPSSEVYGFAMIVPVLTDTVGIGGAPIPLAEQISMAYCNLTTKEVEFATPKRSVPYRPSGVNQPEHHHKLYECDIRQIMEEILKAGGREAASEGDGVIGSMQLGHIIINTRDGGEMYTLEGNQGYGSAHGPVEHPTPQLEAALAPPHNPPSHVRAWALPPLLD